MLGYPIYWLRYFFWWLKIQLCRSRKVPAILVLSLSGDYAQIPVPLSNPLLRYFRPPRISLFELGRTFQRVAADARVEAVLLHLHGLSMTAAKLDTLRDYIHNLRQSGKWVVAYASHYDLGSYYLACAADEILLQPGGEIGPLGLRREYIYLADAFAWAGIQADFVQISPYKSAGDRFTRNAMSDEVRQMGNWLADASWNEFVAAVAHGRDWDDQTARRLLDETPCTDIQAEDWGFINARLHEDDLPVYFGDAEHPAKLTPWFEGVGRLRSRPPRRPGNYVALMSIEGLIVDGTSQQPPIEPPIPLPVVLESRAGDVSVVRTARQIANDKHAAAVVLFVDSPGGAATASEAMAAALMKLAQVKPFVVVMGAVAASGGYYVATPGKQIILQPNTITGSIGVLSGKFADTGLLAKLFIHRETISRGAAAHFYDPAQPWTDAERAKLMQSIQRMYEIFLERVAASREMAKEEVDAIGGGRVWTGRQALENGLADELGGVERALAIARQFAQLHEDAGTRIFYPAKKPVMPSPTPAALLKYALDGITLLGNRMLVLYPWVER